MATSAAACQAMPTTLTAQKYQCLVLWRKASMPNSPPTAPQKKEHSSRTFSEMRHAPRLALDLSAPYKIKVTKDISANAAIKTIISFSPK